MFSDLQRIFLARSLRAFGDGFVAILLPVHLSSLGYDPFTIGLISTVMLLGSACLTLTLGFLTHRMPRRRILLAASLLMFATGIGFAGFTDFWPLLVIGFVGTLNPSSGDVSLFLPMEHTLLAHLSPAKNRTAIFARYSFIGAVVAALGALASGMVDWLAPFASRSAILTGFFILYGVLGLVTFLVYRGLSAASEVSGERKPAPLGKSRGRVYGLAALFSVDSFGGGLVVNSLLALWLFERFGLDVETTGLIFFVTGLCSAFSFFAAVPLARRFGHVNTMVFTHLPANAFLIMTAFAPDIWVAFGLLILRSLLSQMDVPARSSYVMAIVEPEERPAAASLTAVPRSLASALAPALSGWLLALSPFGWPLVLAGGLKIAYDLALLNRFSKIKPPEE